MRLAIRSSERWSRRQGSCDSAVRRVIAMVALVLGVILGTSEPEYLIALIPIEALIAFELIFWNDCSVQRRHERGQRESDKGTKFADVNRRAKS